VNKIENKEQNDKHDFAAKSNENLDYKVLFKNVFEFSPISLWEEDLSLVFEGLEKIRSEGVSDLKKFLLSNPDFVENLIKKIEILNVNNAAVDLLEADSKDELIGSFAKFFDRANLDLFMNELLSIWNKDELFSADYRALSLKGNPLFTQLQFKIPQEPSEFKNVFISILDLTKLKNVEKKLLNEQELYRTIFTLAPSGIVIEDKRGIILDANDAQHISLGYSEGELIGLNVRNLASIENKFLVDENISKVLNGEILIQELESLKKDGSRCINALRETRIPLPNGEYGILNFSTDVTEKRKLEEALKKREEAFSSLFNLSSEILIVSDPSEGKIPTTVFVNDTAIETYGYSREELIGKPISTFISDVGKIKDRLLHLTSGQTITFETKHFHKDGTSIPVYITAKLITLFGKDHVYSIVRDISLEKEQEKKQKQRIKFLKASNKISELILTEKEVYVLLSRVINVIGEKLELDRVFVYNVNLKNSEGRMLTVWNNPQTNDLIQAENIYSVETFEKAGKYLLLKKDIIESYFDEIHQVFKGEPGSILHKKLKIKTLLWMPFAFSADGFLLLALNQTKYRRVFNESEKEFIRSVAQQINLAIMKIGFLKKQLKDEEELKKLSQAVEQSSRLKSIFLSQMSHEIRTPVNTMISFASLLKDELEDQVNNELAKCFDGIDRAGRRIIRTTELLLNLSEIKTNTYEPNFKMIDLNIEILGPLALEFKQQASERKLKFKYKIKSAEAVIRGDLISIEKIFRHLIENAIKFTNNGTVGLNVYKNSKNHVVAEISDTGIGILEEFLPQLYTTFTQEEMGYSRRYDGNGIGLSLVSEYCKLNNITIEAKTKKGEGTTFMLTFLNVG